MQSLNAALPYIVLAQLALTLVLAVLVLGIARQVGVLHERVAPMGAMTSDRGPAVGEVAPPLPAETLDGDSIEIGGPSARTRLLLFISPSCPVCKKLLPIARSVMHAERIEIILIGDGERAEQRAMIKQFGLEGITYVNSPRLGLAHQVGKLPYAVLIDADGVVRAKGLVNTREHLESLIVAEQTGFGTIQDYLAAGTAAHRSPPASSVPDEPPSKPSRPMVRDSTEEVGS
jgi:methylamine dehydrogenase accessory protein MauD